MNLFLHYLDIYFPQNQYRKYKHQLNHHNFLFLNMCHPQDNQTLNGREEKLFSHLYKLMIRTWIKSAYLNSQSHVDQKRMYIAL